MRAPLLRAMRAVLLVAVLGTLASLLGISGAGAAATLPTAGSATPPVPTSTITPDPQPGTVTYCVDNYAPNSTVQVVNNANGETGTIHTNGNGHGCTHMPIKTGCNSVSNTIVATGTDQDGKAASSQATYNAPPDSSKCASPSPSPTPTCDASGLTLSVTVVPQGATVVGRACGFTPGETVAGFVESKPIFVGDTTAADDGSARMSVAIPECIEPGQHTFSLQGETSGHVASADFTVEPSNACQASTLPGGGFVPPPGGGGVDATNTGTGGNGLAFTGANIAAMVLVALVLLALGIVIVASVRRRRAATAA